MRSAPKIACLFFLGLALLGSGRAGAQGSSPPPEPNEPWQSPPPERAAAPDVYLLPDANGKLRQVLGFHYEDFLRAWNNRDAAGAGPPRYAIEVLQASGTSEESQVRLRIELSVGTHVESWIRVPLHLEDLIVERVEFDERLPGECLIYDAERDGHVAWLSGRANQERKITITGLAKVSTNAGKSSFEVSLPQATTSQVRLVVPETDVEFSSSPGTELTTKVGGGQSEAEVRGNADPLRIEWSRRQESSSVQTTILEAQGEMAVAVDRRRATYKARLRLDSFGNPLEQVRVRLPEGVNLTDVQTPPERQATVSETSAAEGNIVEIRSKRPSGEPWFLEVSAEQPLEESDAAAVCQVSGFEVLGAVRQSGQLTLEVDEQLQAYFDLSGDLEQVPLVESEDLKAPQTALAAFAYARFPWALTVHTLPKQQRVNVAPDFRLRLTPDQARLELVFDYQFSGARTFAVRVDLRGWQLTDDPLESGGTVDVNRVVETQQGLLVLPLVNPDAQRARIALVVRKPLKLGEQVFELPEALGGFVLPGQLVVQADPSLQVTSDVSRLEGLGALATTEQEAAGDDSPLVFRTFLSRVSFGATIARRQRQVSVDAHSTVEVRENQLAVRQQFDYLVKYRSLALLELKVPRDLPDQLSMRVLLDDKELATTTSRQESPDEQETSQRLHVSLPLALQGEFSLELAFDLPYEGANPKESVQVLVPLATPTDPLGSHDVAVLANPPQRISLGQSPAAKAWNIQQAESSSAASTTTWRLQSSVAESTLPLALQMDSLEDLQNTILERAWLQSWVVGDQQQDRAVFQYRSSHAKVYVELPATAVGQALEVILDSEPVEFELPSESRLAVSLPHVSPRARHVLELRYHHPVDLLSGASLRTALPQLVCRPMSAPVYWQLVLPRGWHVAQSPEDMTSEAWLGWKEYRWGRQPTRSQGHLEQWTGASSAPPPPTTTSQYLYSAFEVPEHVEVVVARQIWLVLAATLAAFGVGMLCVYTPIAGAFSFWLGLALALLALVFVYPELTLLAGQAILWGGVMTLAVLVLRRAFLGRSAGEIVLSSAASSLIGSTPATGSWVQKQRITSDSEDSPTVAARADGSKV